MVALARRSPSARLYSLVPRSSQWPSIRTRLLALRLQPRRVLVEDLRVGGADVVPVEVEEDVLERRVRRELTRARRRARAGAGVAGRPAAGHGDGRGLRPERRRRRRRGPRRGAGANGERVGAGAAATGGGGTLRAAHEEQRQERAGASPRAHEPRRMSHDRGTLLLKRRRSAAENRVQSYHGRRGDHAGLVAVRGAIGQRLLLRAVGEHGEDPRAARSATDWNTRCRPLGAQDALSLSPGPW